MSKLLRKVLPLAALASALLPVGIGRAANVRGSVAPGIAKHAPDTVGYTRTRILAPGKLSTRPDDLALFLKVKNSLPLPAPTSVPTVELVGFRLSPQVAACAVDGKVQFKNSSSTSVTLKIGDSPLTVPAGETKEYDCVVGKPGDDLRSLRIVEWPYARGAIFVGEVGVAALPGERGAFTLPASPGKYELLVVGLSGVVTTKEVELGKVDVDVGAIDLTGGQEEGSPATP